MIEFTVPENPDPGVLAHPYFVFADTVGLPMERLDEWHGRSDDRYRTMYLIDTDGGVWVARGQLPEDGEPPTPTTAEARAWARSHGLAVGTRGRLPTTVQDRYDKWVTDYFGPWPSTFSVIATPEATT